MNYFRTKFEIFDANEKPVLNQYQRAWLWCQKFWQFSLFYGNYLADLHSRKDR